MMLLCNKYSEEDEERKRPLWERSECAGVPEERLAVFGVSLREEGQSLSVSALYTCHAHHYGEGWGKEEHPPKRCSHQQRLRQTVVARCDEA